MNKWNLQNMCQRCKQLTLQPLFRELSCHSLLARCSNPFTSRSWRGGGGLYSSLNKLPVANSSATSCRVETKLNRFLLFESLIKFVIKKRNGKQPTCSSCRHPAAEGLSLCVSQVFTCLIFIIWGSMGLCLFDEGTVRLSKLRVETPVCAHLVCRAR